MMQLLNILYVAAGVLLLFGAAVFVHEFGHYWMARKRGLKVEAFAIGFGPKILGWTKDGIEYSWRWIPAGGYVKLPQMVTSEAIEGSGETQEVIPPAAPFSKILVAFAGPFMNIVFAFVIATVLYVVGLPVLVNPSIIGHVDPDSPEAALGIRQGDRIVEVDGQRVRTWQQVQMATVLARTNVLPVVLERDGERTTYQLATITDPTFNLKIFNLYPQNTEITDVLSGGAAEAGGLRPGDTVLSFAGIPVAGPAQLVDLIGKRAEQPTEMVVERGSEKVTLSVTPVPDPATGKARIGVQLGGGNVYQLQKPGPLPWVQIADVWDKTIRTLGALFHWKETGVGIKDLSGPPGILAMLGAQLNADYRLALSFLVLLNVNLAILNLLPIPVLDGGHIVMAILERIRGRPISVRVLEYTTAAFAILLISLMLYVSFNDITKRGRVFRDMFRGETRIEQQDEPPPAQPAPAVEPAP